MILLPRPFGEAFSLFSYRSSRKETASGEPCTTVRSPRSSSFSCSVCVVLAFAATTVFTNALCSTRIARQFQRPWKSAQPESPGLGKGSIGGIGPKSPEDHRSHRRKGFCPEHPRGAGGALSREYRVVGIQPSRGRCTASSTRRPCRVCRLRYGLRHPESAEFLCLLLGQRGLCPELSAPFGQQRGRFKEICKGRLGGRGLCAGGIRCGAISAGYSTAENKIGREQTATSGRAGASSSAMRI